MELREQCMNRTMELLSTQGLKFTMNDLAKDLHVSKKTLYKVFDSKEDMLLAIADDCFATIKQSEREVLEDGDLPLLQKIKRLIIVLPEQYKNLNWYLMEEVAERYPKVYAYIRKRMENDWEPTLQLLEEGMAQGVLKSINIYVFKGMVEGCMEHFLISSELKEQKIGYMDALEAMMDILLRGIVKEEYIDEL